MFLLPRGCTQPKVSAGTLIRSRVNKKKTPTWTENRISRQKVEEQLVPQGEMSPAGLVVSRRRRRRTADVSYSCWVVVAACN